MNNFKSIICNFCGDNAGDFNGEIICGNPLCQAYPKIVSAKSATLEEKIKALLRSGPKTIDQISQLVKEHRNIVSGILYQMKQTGEASSEYDSDRDAFAWALTTVKQVEVLTYEQKCNLVMQALKAGKHLPRAIAKNAKLSESETIITLTRMEEDGEISRKNETNFSAWFLNGKVPNGKLILDGTGGLIELKVATPEISPEVRRKAEENLRKSNQQILESNKQAEQTREKFGQKVLESSQIINVQKPEPITKTLENTEGKMETATKQKVTEKSVTEPAKNGGKSGKYTAEMFEEFGKKGLGKYKIAAELNVQYNTVWRQFNLNPGFEEAYQRGLEIYKNSETYAQKFVWTDETFFNLAAKHFDIRPAAKEIGKDLSSLHRMLGTNNNFARAWFRGQLKFIENNPGFQVSNRSRFWDYKKRFGAELLGEELKVGTPLGEDKSANYEKSLKSKFDHIEIVIEKDKGICTLKCGVCHINRSFGLFLNAEYDQEKINIALDEYEAEHSKCKIAEAEAVRPIVINSRISEIRERLSPITSIAVSAKQFRDEADEIPKENFLPIQISGKEINEEQFIAQELPAVVSNPNQKQVQLGKGFLKLNLEEFNLFEADEETRMFLHNLINQIQEFEEQKSGQISLG